MGIEPRTLDHHANALLTELSQHLIASLNHHCSFDSRNNQSPKCEIVDETKLTSEMSCPTHTCLAQSVEHQGDDQNVLGFNPH